MAGADPAAAPVTFSGKSSRYKQMESPDARPQQWSSGPVEVSTVPLSAKGTLLEGGAGLVREASWSSF